MCLIAVTKCAAPALVNGPESMNYAQGAAALGIVAVLFGGDLVMLFRGEQVAPRPLLCWRPELCCGALDGVTCWYRVVVLSTPNPSARGCAQLPHLVLIMLFIGRHPCPAYRKKTA